MHGAARRLDRARYGTTPVFIETFVEIPRYTSAIQKASGWTHVGTTERKHDETAGEYAMESYESTVQVLILQLGLLFFG